MLEAKRQNPQSQRTPTTTNNHPTRNPPQPTPTSQNSSKKIKNPKSKNNHRPVLVRIQNLEVYSQN
ncbi:hypothetical protein RA265_28140, partial [Pseudomonas syringae pv. tagetis]|uniref:hypothetical protein n=1 Tax=Pseudomonas syringae group genomosp. 7 TaxID=251699 RepID=UPI0037702BCF